MLEMKRELEGVDAPEGGLEGVDIRESGYRMPSEELVRKYEKDRQGKERLMG